MIDKFEGRWRFLSNFYPCEIEHQGILYPSVEHYYISMKFTSDQFIDGKNYTCGDLREKISKIPSPGRVKRLGKSIKLRKDWEEVRFDIMTWGVREKFKTPSLSELMLTTEEEELIEGNYWHDCIWGRCICDKCMGKGKNNLGKILMKVRE